MNRTRPPAVASTLDSGSHINGIVGTFGMAVEHFEPGEPPMVHHAERAPSFS
jgi:hypothetical protein